MHQRNGGVDPFQPKLSDCPLKKNDKTYVGILQQHERL